MMGTQSEPGISKQAVEQLFFAVEETPERCFLMQVSIMDGRYFVTHTKFMTIYKIESFVPQPFCKYRLLGLIRLDEFCYESL